jgi:hypothetical protein
MLFSFQQNFITKFSKEVLLHKRKFDDIVTIVQLASSKCYNAIIIAIHNTNSTVGFFKSNPIQILKHTLEV